MEKASTSYVPRRAVVRLRAPLSLASAVAVVRSIEPGDRRGLLFRVGANVDLATLAEV